jgi:signal transduction histidine kinase
MQHQIYDGLLKGVELYLTKPFDGGELLDLVQSQLAQTLQTQDKHSANIDQLQTELSRRLQHEFRTPLTFIVANMEFLYSDVSAEKIDDLNEHLAGLQRGSQRMGQLVSDLLRAVDCLSGEYAQAIRRNLRLQNRPLDLLEAVIMSKRAEAEAQNVKLFYRPRLDDLSICADSDSLRELFERVIDNAIKFTKAAQGGAVRISAEIANDQLQVHIRDNGIGFPPHLSEQLFDLFYQHDRRKYEQQGAGLGLTIAREIAHAHGGTLTLTGHPDRGAAVVISLPCGPCENLPVPPSTADDNTATILIVEDEPSLLSGLSDLLSYGSAEQRYRCLTAINGKQALAILEKEQPDLIISDVRMPVMNGYDLLDRTRNDERWADIPFILLTAHGSRPEVHRGRLAGADQYVTKPYDSTYLLELVQTRLNRHHQKSLAKQRDFERLKEGVIGAIDLDLLTSLMTLTAQSVALEPLIDSAALNDSQNIATLRAQLVNIQLTSRQISELVEDASQLVDLRSGVARRNFIKRAQLIDSFDYLWVEAIEIVKDQKNGFQHEFQLEPRIQLQRPRFLPPVKGQRKQLVSAFSHWLRSNVDWSMDGQAVVTLRAEEKGICCRLDVGWSRLQSAELQQIAAYVASGTLPTKLPHSNNLLIFNEYMLLHGATVSFFYVQPNSHSFELFFPTYDPFAQ